MIKKAKMIDACLSILFLTLPFMARIFTNASLVAAFGFLACVLLLIFVLFSIYCLLKKCFSFSWVALLIWALFIELPYYDNHSIKTDKIANWFLLYIPSILAIVIGIVGVTLLAWYRRKTKKSFSWKRTGITLLAVSVYMLITLCIFFHFLNYTFSFQTPTNQVVEVVVIERTDEMSDGSGFGNVPSRKYIVQCTSHPQISIDSVIVKESYPLAVGDKIVLRYYSGILGGSYKVIYDSI